MYFLVKVTSNCNALVFEVTSQAVFICDYQREQPATVIVTRNK